MDDEVSLRDLYWMVRGHALSIGALALASALVTLLFCLRSPKRYSSEAAISLVTAAQSGSSVTGQLLVSMPPAITLAQGFSQQISTGALAKTFATSDRAGYEAAFDEKRSLLNLKATALSREEAREDAERLLRAAQNYLHERLTGVAMASLQSSLANARVDLVTVQRSLEDVQKLVKGSQPGLAPMTLELSAALEAQKVDPQIARSARPALTYLGLQVAQLQAQRALVQARLTTLDEISRDPDSLLRLTGQVEQVRILSAPAEPLRENPRHLIRNATVAGFLGLMFGLCAAFIREALRTPREPGLEGRPTAAGLEESR